MSRIKERDEFVAIVARELSNHPQYHVLTFARYLMSKATTLHRLAEAQCNGDFPADNGTAWKTAPCGGAEDKGCGSYWHPSALKGKDKSCPDCRTQRLIMDACKPFNVTPVFHGDPRGAVLKIQVPSGYTNDWGREGICVP